MFPILNTTRLRLMAPSIAKLPDLFELYSDESTMEYWDTFPHQDISETQEILDLYESRQSVGTGLAWFIQLQNDHTEKVIGTIAFNRYLKGGNAVIGYLLHKDFRKQGLMSEALQAVLQFGFEELQVHRIEAFVNPGNVESEKLLLRHGFLREGLLREREFYKGRHQSIIVYGKLQTDVLM